jgi:hypothetical protein
MQDDPRTFSWQEKLANGRAAIGVASGRFDASALGNASVRAAAIHRLRLTIRSGRSACTAVLAFAGESADFDDGGHAQR